MGDHVPWSIRVAAYVYRNSGGVNLSSGEQQACREPISGSRRLCGPAAFDGYTNITRAIYEDALARARDLRREIRRSAKHERIAPINSVSPAFYLEVDIPDVPDLCVQPNRTIDQLNASARE